MNASQFPPGTLSGAARPNFVFHTTDFWAQGLNVGLEYRFLERISHGRVPLLGYKQCRAAGYAPHCFCEAVAHWRPTLLRGENRGLNLVDPASDFLQKVVEGLFSQRVQAAGDR